LYYSVVVLYYIVEHVPIVQQSGKARASDILHAGSLTASRSHTLGYATARQISIGVPAGVVIILARGDCRSVKSLVKIIDLLFWLTPSIRIAEHWRLGKGFDCRGGEERENMIKQHLLTILILVLFVLIVFSLIRSLFGGGKGKK